VSLENEFKTALDSGDVDSVRAMIIASIENDTTLEDYQEKIDCAEHMHGLFEEQNDTILHNDTSLWTKDYLNDLTSDLAHNFSRERLEALKQVALHINKPDGPPKKTGRDILLGGLAITITGFVLSHTSLMIAGAVVITGGVVIFAVDYLKMRNRQ